MGRRSFRDPQKQQALGKVPESFARFFREVPEHQLGQALRDYMHEEFGSPYAHIFWLTDQAARAERDSVRLDATRLLIELLHGKAPTLVEVKAGKDDERSTAPVPDRERLALVAGILQQVGALPHAGAAMLTRGKSDAEVEQVPPANR